MENVYTLFVYPIMDMVVKVGDFIPTLLIALGILIFGWIVARVIVSLLGHFLKAIEFDKLSDKMGLTKFLHKGGIKRKPADLVGCLTYWTFMSIVLITTVKSFGLYIVSGLVDKVLAYIPSVVSGVCILIIGMLLARFVSAIVYVTAKNTDMPSPATLSRVSKLAIMTYVGIMFLREIGFVALFAGSHYTIFIGGIVFALALAFGLAGKDVAAKYLHVISTKTTN